MSSENMLYSSLPAVYLADAPEIAPVFVEKFLKSELKASEQRDVSKNLKWNFVLEKYAARGKTKAKRIRKKKTFLTRQQRKDLNILKLPKTGWDYDSLDSMRSLWRGYMRENLDLAGSAPDCAHADWPAFSTILAKSELIGAEIRVVRSQAPSMVGLSGTVVLESKMVFQIVTKESHLKTLPKATSVFEICVNSLKFTIFGKHLMTKPSERSVKKIKTQMLPDL